jgi:uncharacterized Zn finger protein
MPPRRWAPFPSYVSAEQRRARAAAAAVRLGKQAAGAEPIRIEGRDITSTFWGKAWCQNLQSYADFAYRLDRGRSYVRAGAVVDLKISEGQVRSRVSGSQLYQVQVQLAPLDPERWQQIARASTGRIGSLVGLLRGEMPDDVMHLVTDRQRGLFPAPRELDMSCDCPDSAILCKHVAATLYGVGARFDARPELLFLLRGVNAQDLLDRATAGLGTGAASGAATLDSNIDDLSALFGIELWNAPDTPPAGEMPKPQRKAKATALPSPVLSPRAGRGTEERPPLKKGARPKTPAKLKRRPPVR